MDNVMLFVKFLLFFGLEFTVLFIIVAVLIAGLYQIVRDKVQKARREDEIAPEAGSTASASSTSPFRS